MDAGIMQDQLSHTDCLRVGAKDPIYPASHENYNLIPSILISLITVIMIRPELNRGRSIMSMVTTVTIKTKLHKSLNLSVFKTIVPKTVIKVLTPT